MISGLKTQLLPVTRDFVTVRSPVGVEPDPIALQLDFVLDASKSSNVMFEFSWSRTTVLNNVWNLLVKTENVVSVPHKASSASCFCGLSSVSKRLY